MALFSSSMKTPCESMAEQQVFGMRACLESGLACPRNAFAYGEADLCELGGLYAAGVVKNYPFVDGNNRTGFLCAAVFLEINGLRLTASEADVVAMTLALAAGEADEDVYAAWLRDNIESA